MEDTKKIVLLSILISRCFRIVAVTFLGSFPWEFKVLFFPPKVAHLVWTLLKVIFYDLKLKWQEQILFSAM